MVRLFFLCCLALVLVSPAGQASEKTITLGAIHYPPYTILETNGDFNGFDGEVVREAFQRMGLSLKIETFPWKRVVQNALTGQTAGIISCAARPEQFLVSAPISTATDALFFNSDHDFSRYPISNISDLLKFPELQVGAVAGYQQVKLLDDLNVPYDSSPEDKTAFKKLFAGRIDVFLTIQEFGNYTLKQLNLSHLTKTISIRSKTYHLCLNKAIEGADVLLSRFNRTVATMRTDGTYQAIHNKYK